MCVIDNYVQALSNVHFDFSWPYPILVDQYNKSIINFFINIFKIYLNKANSFVIESNESESEKIQNKSDFIYDTNGQDKIQEGI